MSKIQSTAQKSLAAESNKINVKEPDIASEAPANITGEMSFAAYPFMNENNKLSGVIS